MEKQILNPRGGNEHGKTCKKFSRSGKGRYDQINSEIEKREADLQGLKNERKSNATYLQSVGVLEKAKRGPRKKK
mgnify:CR=1 FL=1